MKLIYSGPFTAGTTLDIKTGRVFAFTKGEPVDLPNDLAASLLKQEQHWASANPPAEVSAKKEVK